MRRLLLLFLVLPASARAQDDTDKTVLGKKASEWMVLLRDAKEVRQRRVALIALDQAGPQTRKVFEEVGSALLLDKEEIVRLSAAQVLGSLGARARDPERLDKIPVKPAVDALMAALSKEKLPSVRKAICTAVGRIGPEARLAVPALGAALKDADIEVRAAAAEALSRIGPEAKDAAANLRDALEDNKGKEQMQVRLWAASAVQRIGRPGGLPAVGALVGVLKEPEPAGLTFDERRLLADVHRKTVEALGTLGDAAAAAVLTTTLEKALKTKDVTLGRTTLTALTQLLGDKKALVPALLQAMAPPSNLLQDSFIRSGAIHAIGSLGRELDRTQRKTVLDNLSLSLTDKVSEVRLAAVLALGELGPEVVGDEAKSIVDKLQVLRRSTEKSISEAADATIAKLK